MQQLRQTLAFGLGSQELLVIVVLVLLLFGGNKVPQLMNGLGREVAEFQKGIDESRRAINRASQESKTVAMSEPEEAKTDDSENA